MNNLETYIFVLTLMLFKGCYYNAICNGKVPDMVPTPIYFPVPKKNPQFLKLNPYGTVPVAFNISGSIGVFESNSILRVIARLGKKRTIYGNNSFNKSRIDSYLDACLVFATLTQNYTLSLYSNKKISKR